MSKPESPKDIYRSAHFIPLSISLAAGAVIWFSPEPVGVETTAWHLLAVFVALIIGLIGKALPMGGISFLALTTLILTRTLTMKEAFSGFSYPIIWLVVAAFFLSKSFIKTGLSMRFAHFFVSLLGKKTLGLGYGIALTELMLAPAIPSNTARSGGVIFPIIRALAISFGSTPERHSQRLIGSYLILTAYYCNLITSAMFVTAMAANPLILSIFLNTGLSMTWGTWALASIIPGILSLICIPWIVYKLYPPEITSTPEAKAIAQKHLKEMGAIGKYEWITLIVFCFLIFLWILGESLFGIESTAVALLGVCVLMVTGVLTWDDIKKEYEAWDTLVWFSTLVMIANYLTQFGLTEWISHHIHYFLNGLHWTTVWSSIVLIYFYSHYFFASNTAHAASMLPALLTVGIALQIPPYLIAFSLAFCSSLFACLTHYGTGCAPILFGSEYVNLKTWWRMGLIISFVFLFIWVGIGACWWKILGFW